jgi:hypothetical protein
MLKGPGPLWLGCWMSHPSCLQASWRGAPPPRSRMTRVVVRSTSPPGMGTSRSCLSGSVEPHLSYDASRAT